MINTNLNERIKYTNKGFSYIKVSPIENLNWGGFCICNGCDKQVLDEEMYLIFVLTDTYCKNCFKEWSKRQQFYSQEDIEYDLNLQNKHHLEWYKRHLERG